MSVSSVKVGVAYLSQGKIRVLKDQGRPETFESVYGDSIREKSVRSQQRHSWKGQGGEGGLIPGSALWGRSENGDEVPVNITSLCGGRDAGELFYSLESGSLCALLGADVLAGEERRIWNDNRTRLRHIAASRVTGDMVFSILHDNGTANIGVRLAGEPGVHELTEGDSFDTAPRWAGTKGRKVVFQSAGIGRNREGEFVALGPFALQKLDAETGEMEMLKEDSAYDFLAPHESEDGTLHYIRRPYSGRPRTSPMQVLKDIVLFPFRLLSAVFGFLNVFSAMFSGRKLTTGGAKAREMDMRQMMIWGNLVRAERKENVEEGADMVPRSWQLMRSRSGGESESITGGVLAYDVDGEGNIVYTNGNAVFLLPVDGKRHTLIREQMIEQVFFLP